jgi:hypothetical protein
MEQSGKEGKLREDGGLEEERDNTRSSDSDSEHSAASHNVDTSVRKDSCLYHVAK